MTHANIYLNFDGNAAQAFTFYSTVFGREISRLQQFKDMPGTESLSDAARERILHISLPIGEHSILMGSDTMPGQSPNLLVGNNTSISITVDSDDEAQKLFDALAQGGQVIMPIQKTFWGAFFGMVHDQFGTQWMISHES